MPLIAVPALKRVVRVGKGRKAITAEERRLIVQDLGPSKSYRFPVDRKGRRDVPVGSRGCVTFFATRKGKWNPKTRRMEGDVGVVVAVERCDKNRGTKKAAKCLKRGRYNRCLKRAGARGRYVVGERGGLSTAARKRAWQCITVKPKGRGKGKRKCCCKRRTRTGKCARARLCKTR